jgi:peptidoglycan hydrolase-like protein with peptidoglycan-binding domain
MIVSTVVGGLLIAAACGGGSNPGVGEAGAGRESTSTTAASSSTAPTTASSTTTTTPATTTTTPTTTAPPPAPPPDAASDGTLRPGESGQPVLDLQNQLTALGYWLGQPDSGYGTLTQQAVMAFQKAEGLGRDGIAGPETLGRLATAGRPVGRSTSGNLIEIDLTRQLLLVIENGQVKWAFNTSTGTSSTPTPQGTYAIERQIDGYRRSELGLLYRPKYFVGGVAIHGSTSIPGYPASHACTRLTNSAMDLLWSSGVAGIGTTVWTYA